MNTPPRDFVSVDMRGLKAALQTRSRESHRSVSDLVRTAVAEWLGAAQLAPSDASSDANDEPATLKVSIRLPRTDVELLARNFGPVMAMAAKTTVASVHEIVEAGAIDPETVVTPGLYVQRVVQVDRVATTAGGYKQA